MQIVLNDLVRRRIGKRDVAFDLRDLDGIGQIRKRDGRIVRRLRIQTTPRDGIPIQTGRGACL